jgi:NADPH:quinone reductase-like Zn-dependent oxidoreductase
VNNLSVIVTKIGGPEVVQVVTSPLPVPGPGEVRIRVEAAGLSQADITIREGMYPQSAAPPFVLGYDAVGIVDAHGAGVTSPPLGQRVAAITVRGSHTRFLCWPAAELIAVPEGIEPAKAVCLLLNYLTAYQLLHRVARVQPGQRVLVQSAAGGVGTALLQLGQLHGLELFGTASTPKLETVRALGATPIDYTRGDLVAEVRQHAPDGVDVAFDAIGGASYTRSFRTLGPQGLFIGYGFTAKMGQPIRGRIDTFARMGWMFLTRGRRRVSFYGIMFMKAAHPEWFHADLVALFQLYQHGYRRTTQRIRVMLCGSMNTTACHSKE